MVLMVGDTVGGVVSRNENGKILQAKRKRENIARKEAGIWWRCCWWQKTLTLHENTAREPPARCALLARLNDM